jgi:hypothetical protein
MKLFFIEMFWAWADKLEFWGIFGQTISTQFGTLSPLPLSMFSIIQPFFLHIHIPNNYLSRKELRNLS